MADKVEIKIGGNTSGARASIKDLEDMSKRSFSKMSGHADESSVKVSGSFKKAGIRTEKAINDSSRKARQDFERLKNSGVATANEIKRAHSVMTARIKRNNRELGVGIGKLANAFKKAKGNIFAAAAAIGASLAGALSFKAVGEAVGFEAALLDLQKVMSDSEGDAKAWTGTVEALSKQFGISATEILQGAANFKQAGFSVAEAFKLQEDASKLVVASDLEAAEAAELLVSILKGFKAPAKEAARVTDILNEISNKYATNVRELAIAMADVSPVAKIMGFSFEETAGLLTPIIEVFRSGSESAQGFRTGLLKLLDDSVPVTAALDSLGVSQREGVNKTMRSGKDIVADVAQAFRGLDDNSKLAFATQLVGIRQAARMVEVFDGLAKTTEVTNVAMDAHGSINKEVAIRLAATEVKGKRAAQSFKIMSKAIGNVLLPVWNKLLDVAIVTFDVMAKGFKKVEQLIDALPNFTRFLALPIFLAKTSQKAVKGITDIVKANEEYEASEKKVQAQLAEGQNIFEERKKSREGEAEQLKENAQVAIEAADAQIKAQKAQNEVLKQSINATKKELRDLESELKRAQGFTRQVLDEIAKSEKTRAQAGFGSVEKLIDDLKRAEDNFQLAAAERAAGNIDRARELTLSSVQAANAVLEAQESAGDELTVASVELGEAATNAEDLVRAAKNFAFEMEAVAKDAVPSVAKNLETLESQLALGKETLTGVKDSIAEATAAAELLKIKLSEDTTSTHTQIINTVGTGGASSVPGFSTGVKLPGYGGGDKILARLEAGERVIKKEAVRSLETLGERAMSALHQGDISGLIKSLPAYQEGGKVETPQPSSSVNVNLNLGNKNFPMSAQSDVANDFVKQIKSINVVRGRKRTVY